MGGGSGPTNSTTYNQNIPPYAQPYVLGNGTSSNLGLLPQAAALTNINQNPYQQYQGQMVAGLDPLQQQAMGNIQQMTPSSQLGPATGMTGLAGMQAGNISQTYNPGQIGTMNYTGPNVSQYMSPYTQNVVQQQQNQAIQNYAQNLPQLGSAASMTGNLGSSREDLLQSQAASNLQQQLQGITASGYQGAFQNAQQQFNAQQQAQLQAQGQSLQSQQFGAGLGLQGLQTQIGAAGQLGNLGQTQYGQQAGIAQAQLGAGQTAQNVQQELLNTQYQNFVNQQNYPYAQLGFLSNMLTGAASNAAGTYGAATYQQAPNVAGQLAGLGTAATGLAGLFGSSGAAGGVA